MNTFYSWSILIFFYFFASLRSVSDGLKNVFSLMFMNGANDIKGFDSWIKANSSPNVFSLLISILIGFNLFNLISQAGQFSFLLIK